MNSWNGRVPGHVMFPDSGPEGKRIKTRYDYHCSTCRECGKRRSDQPVHMKQRHYAESHIISIQSVSVRDVMRRRQQIFMCERYTLWTVGGSAGVKNQCDVFRTGFMLCGTVRTVRVRSKSHLAICIDVSFDDDRVIGSPLSRRRHCIRRDD